MPFDVIAVGRISVDLYAQEPNASFAQQQTFTKSIGGSPTNVAVAAARLGLRSALVTGVGRDGLGSYALARLGEFGVDTRFVHAMDSGRTPLVLASLDPPEEPAVCFYRDGDAPDTRLGIDAVPVNEIADCAVLWTSGCALAQQPTAESMLGWMRTRKRRQVVLDLDYRQALWPSPQAAREAAATAIELSSVVVGNRSECEMAVGTREPDLAADRLLASGVDVAVVKMGADGVLFATSAERCRVRPTPVTVVCGLGSGDAFGGALAYGLQRGLSLARMGELANASGAIVASRPMCADAMPTLAEVEAFLASGVTDGREISS
jgi:5-dehydro-2-deoxygluconokinase